MGLGEENHRDKVPFSSDLVRYKYYTQDLSLMMIVLITCLFSVLNWALAFTKLHLHFSKLYNYMLPCFTVEDDHSKAILWLGVTRGGGKI